MLKDCGEQKMLMIKDLRDDLDKDVCTMYIEQNYRNIDSAEEFTRLKSLNVL